MTNILINAGSGKSEQADAGDREGAEAGRGFEEGVTGRRQTLSDAIDDLNNER